MQGKSILKYTFSRCQTVFAAMTLSSNEMSDVSFVGEAQENGHRPTLLPKSCFLKASNPHNICRSIEVRKGFEKKTNIFQQVMNYFA